MMYYSFYILVDSICYNFVKNIYKYIHERYYVLFCDISVWFQYQGNVSTTVIWEVFPLDLFIYF